MRAVKYDRWRSLELEELFPTARAVPIALEYQRNGAVTTHLGELAALAVITRCVCARRIFEIGTFRGQATLTFAQNCPDDGVVFTLDLRPAERARFAAGTNGADANIISNSEPGAAYRGKPGVDKITQLWGDSTHFDFRPYTGTIDLMFIDGAHHYSARYMTLIPLCGSSNVAGGSFGTTLPTTVITTT
jgi:predicted O-methyltransferase YrrM